VRGHQFRRTKSLERFALGILNRQPALSPILDCVGQVVARFLDRARIGNATVT
jgi:hypothetical protein